MISHTKQLDAIAEELRYLGKGFIIIQQGDLSSCLYRLARQLGTISIALHNEECNRASEAVKVAEQSSRNVLEAALAGMKAKSSGDEP
jgi:hypothetical protein